MILLTCMSLSYDRLKRSCAYEYDIKKITLQSIVTIDYEVSKYNICCK